MRQRRRPSRDWAGKAVRQLREAPESECPHCGRMTKTTSDGVCADCWGDKGGSMLLHPQQPGRVGRFLLRLVSRSARSR